MPVSTWFHSFGNSVRPILSWSNPSHLSLLEIVSDSMMILSWYVIILVYATSSFNKFEISRWGVLSVGFSGESLKGCWARFVVSWSNLVGRWARPQRLRKGNARQWLCDARAGTGLVAMSPGRPPCPVTTDSLRVLAR